MRLAFSGVRMPKFHEVTKDYLQFYKDIGFRVVGGHLDLNASEDDIKRLKDLFNEMDLEFGECHTGVPVTMGCPDENKFKKEYVPIILKVLRVGGKLGVPHIQFSIGSMHPESIWGHHPENHTQRAMDILVNNAKEMAKYAEDNRCMLSPETTQWTIVNNVERMKEYVDRVNSPYMKITLDVVNQTTSDNAYETGRFARCAVATLGDRIGNFHVKDVMIEDKLLVVHIDEAPMGTGIYDHASLIKASEELQPWKAFVLEHIRSRELIKPAYDHIMKISGSLGHNWTDHHCTRDRWEKGLCK